MLLISDANIFIDLHKIGLLDSFDKLGIKVATSDFVFNELNSEQKEIVENLNISIFELNSSEMGSFFNDFMSLNQNVLSHQDYSIFYFAKKHNGQVLTNDKALRKFSKKEQIEIKGIFYIMDLIIDKQEIANDILISALTTLSENSWLPKKEIEKRIEKLESNLSTENMT